MTPPICPKSQAPSTPIPGRFPQPAKHPEEAVKFVDYLMSPEVMLLTAWGTNEGDEKTYTEGADGTREFTEFVTENPDGLDYDTVRSLYMLPLPD